MVDQPHTLWNQYKCDKCKEAHCICVNDYKPLTVASVTCTLCSAVFVTATDFSNHSLQYHQLPLPIQDSLNGIAKG